MVRGNMLFLSCLGSSALDIFMTDESKKFENNLSTKDKFVLGIAELQDMLNLNFSSCSFSNLPL